MHDLRNQTEHLFMDTTDLATLVKREKITIRTRVIYVVDKRQELHFTQVFRVQRRPGSLRFGDRTEILRFRYHERKRRQTV